MNLQIPIQQNVPVQIPVSAGNGQTLLQTVHLQQTTSTTVPALVHISNGQVYAQLIQQMPQTQVQTTPGLQKISNLLA